MNHFTRSLFQTTTTTTSQNVRAIFAGRSTVLRNTTLTVHRPSIIRPFIPSARQFNQAATTRTSEAGSSSSKDLGRPRRDDEITARYIRLVDENGKIVHERTRLDNVLRQMDREKYYLIEVNPSSNPPVCRLFDRKKLYKHEKEKKKSKQANKVVMKEIMFGWTVSAHDLEHKLARAKAFLDKGNRVTIEIVRKKDQQLLTRDEKQEVIDRVASQLQEYKMMKPPAFVGGSCVMQYENKNK